MARNGYATVWRWHFYAGLFTAPFLLILAITGALYLFNDELNDLIYPQLRFAPSGDAVLPAGDLVAAVREAYPRDTVTRIDMPVSPGGTAMAFVTPEQGEPLRVFVDPGDGTILGDVIYAHTLVGFADVMHGSLLLGRGGDALVELAASWALVLVITGLYLWWPRGRRSRAFRFDRRTRGRKRWREIHRLVGVYTAVMIVFLIITGLPWASFWGDRVLSPVSNALGLGYPPQLRHHGGGEASAAPVKTMVDTLGDAPWALQQAPLPHVHHHHGEHGGELDTSTAAINRVHDILAGQGLPYGYRLSIPAEAGDPYSAYTYPGRPQGQRTLHVDSGGHRLLVNVGFDDYGAIAKAVELGVALHMGNYFGRANQIVMLLTCVAIVALVITGVVMWWRRRPAGGLGAPDSPPIRKRYWLAITLTLLALLPLAGLSLLLVLALEKGMMTRRRSVAG
ncbi:PepSY-associated TM helix domain-containing protein [Alloalcanivorax xenomutans]|uniref:PepSY-associated TM helix domain-containing protein n=1 Tax=Alloalcanivorax xenomutans TaxID=1094342 RepID=UPI001F41336E|nr:PepSY domain-containing protein [Alloalcanivorax xenomutans]MCE7525464.1 PepSY domain-containing protein [Alloalcanivorax xenomutans]WOA32864.1 PepSY domain-containing protein [Alloalcanivorax xenomutans]